MALIEFKNLPDTSTPLTAENLNNNFEYLEDKFTNSIITNSGTITSGTAWAAIDAAPISLLKGTYIIVGQISGIPANISALGSLSGTNGSAIFSKNGSFSGRINITDIIKFNSTTTVKISLLPDTTFSNADISCGIKAIKISD